MNPSANLNTSAPSTRKTDAWWQRVRQTLRRDARPLVGLQSVGVAERDQRELRARLDELGQALGLRFELGRSDASVVVLCVDYAGRAPAPIVKAQIGGRPALLFERAEPPEAQRTELLRQLMQLPQLAEHMARLAPPTTLAAASTLPAAEAAVSAPFDLDFDSRLQADQLQGMNPSAAERALVAHVLRGLHDEGTEVLQAQYGPQAALRMDFAARLVSLDPLALQGLRVRRELPRPGDGSPLTDQAVVHDLDEVVWHLGIACGRYVLLNQPQDHWHAPLSALAAERIERYSRQPRHLDLMRLLQRGPVTPSVLRRQVRIGVADLRCFLQACLFLDLIRWDRPPR
jgi:hypothetical protein